MVQRVAVEMCVVPLADQEADEASGEDEAPPVADPQQKKESRCTRYTCSPCLCTQESPR